MVHTLDGVEVGSGMRPEHYSCVLQLSVPAAVPEDRPERGLVLPPLHRVVRLPDARAKAGPQQLAGAGPRLPPPLQPRLGAG